MVAAGGLVPHKGWPAFDVRAHDEDSVTTSPRRENSVPTYVLLSTLTPEGRETLHKDPDRMEAVNREMTEFGCKVISQYALLGLYDFLTIVEAPDNETVAHLSIDLGSRGSVNIATLPAIPTAQLREKLKGPKQMGRR